MAAGTQAPLSQQQQQPAANGSALTANGAGAGFKLALGAAKPAARTAAVRVGAFGDDEERPEAKRRRGQMVIPKQADTFVVGRVRVPSFLPAAGDGDVPNADRFEQADAEQDRSGISYGLTLRSGAVAADAAQAASSSALTSSTAELERMRYLQEVQLAAAEPTSSAYEAMPIEDFGRAMLAGMGWQENRPVGRRQVDAEGKQLQPVEARQFVARPQKLGLGAAPAPQAEAPQRRFIRPGETRNAGKPDLVYLDEQGREKHQRGEHDVATVRGAGGLQAGADAWVTSGDHGGLRCTVIEVNKRARSALVRLHPSEGTAWVAETHLSTAEPAAQPVAQANGHDRPHKHGKHHKHKRRKEADRGGSKQHKSSRERRGGSPPAADSSDEDVVEPPRAEEPPWLASHTMVKVVDKRLGEGRLYLKKAEVVDVTEPRVCSLYSRDLGKSLAGVHQAGLETVVPRKEHARLLVVRGHHKGQRARLLKRTADTQTVVVQLLADLDTVLKLDFDDVCQYIGEAGEEE